MDQEERTQTFCGHTKRRRRFLLSSRLYCRSWNFTISAIGNRSFLLADFTAGQGFHNALCHLTLKKTGFSFYNQYLNIYQQPQKIKSAGQGIAVKRERLAEKTTLPAEGTPHCASCKKQPPPAAVPANIKKYWKLLDESQFL